ncbi:MAG: helix-turn-helix domain-containing protein [Anaerolineae bacterium]|nr:helix-turn-helix domain-containing protein [Anaerolineae bacterium]
MHKLVSTTFGDWLKQRRRNLGLTREALARRINYSPVAIKKVEANERRPSETMSLMLGKALGVPPDKLDAFVGFARRGTCDADLLRAFVPEESRPLQQPIEEPRPVNPPPAPLNPLIGRQEELAEAIALLKRTKARLVSLIGPPGVGKTRLAVEVALACMTEDEPGDLFADGVVFVPLAPLNHPNQVISAIRLALNLRPASSALLDERGNADDIPNDLVSYLHSRKLLLVLDNFEHLRDATPIVVRLLGLAPGLRVLVTSREPLHVYGEQRFEVRPLRYPTLSQRDEVNLEVLRSFPAVELFEQRAMAIVPSFRLNESNAHDVVQICSELDGLPLAIEMAASCINLIPVRKLRAQLGLHLVKLGYGQRDDSQRFDSLREMIAWSYEQLSFEHRLVFKALSVFADWVDVDAVAAILADTPSVLPSVAPADRAHDQLEHARPVPEVPHTLGWGRPLVTTLLQTLVEKGLALRQFTADDEVCFGMLKVLREFGLEELRASGERDRFMERHARYMLELAQRFGQAASSDGLPYVERIKIMDRYRADFHAALHWAMDERQDIPLAAKLAKAMSNYWISRGLWSEAQHWLYSILRQVNVSPSVSTAAERISILTTLSYELAFVSTQPEILDEIEHLLNQQLAATDPESDVNGTWYLVHSLLLIHTRRGRHHKGHLLHDRLFILAERSGQPTYMVQTLALIGISCWLAGQLDQGIDHCLRAFKMAKELHFIGGASICLENIARAIQLKGDWGQALLLFDQALSYAEQADSAYATAYAMDGIACVSGLLGFAEAFAQLQGIVEALCATSGVVLEPQFRVGYEQALAKSRERLGEERFEALKNQGGRLPYDQAKAYAHRVARDITSNQADPLRIPFELTP